jgi:hypothetical protein
MLLLPQLLAAQDSHLDYRPFAQDSKTWETQVGGIKENVYGNRIEGDTVINGESWKKVYNYVGFQDFGMTYYVALCDVGQKVYAIAKGSTRPRLLYDFSLKEGNTVRCGMEGNVFCCLLDKGEQPDTLLGFPFESYLKVESIDTITYREQAFRRFTLTLLDAYHEPLRNGEEAIFGNVVWIEGVGSGAGPFSPWVPLPTEGCIYQGCELNKQYLCTDFYGNYVPAGIGKIQHQGNVNDASYDLSGHRVSVSSASSVSSVLPKGVYIQNGKKFVVK